ncbi:prepilin-type N-terminal cleavage/methylation domain-containing protein [Elusimicrobium simillimum]|uniref:pilin n=1 Tax=Elusimicrobium simillimum TaxID=3143438 RepID=UPI003C701A29
MNNKKGFTLVELLVVVLIIGILSAIALPQYTKSVEKARAAEAQIMFGALSQSATRHALETGNIYTTMNFDIDFPEGCATNSATKPTQCQNKYFIFGYNIDAGQLGTRVPTKYVGVCRTYNASGDDSGYDGDCGGAIYHFIYDLGTKKKYCYYDADDSDAVTVCEGTRSLNFNVEAY